MDTPKNSTIRKLSLTALFSLILCIVLADLLFPALVVVHWQMVALIGMLVILPFVPLIKRISYGDWEVGLDEQVREAEESVEENIPVPEGIETSDYLPEDIYTTIYDLYAISHTAALAMLRTEIEVVLREIADNTDGDERTPVFHEMMNDIQSKEKLDRETIHTIKEVRSLANIAIHEKGISEDEASGILDLGINALERLYYYKNEKM
jgi:hypothetical protein